MSDYTELVKALRERAIRENEWYEHGGDIIEAAAAAIEALQAELEKKRTADCLGASARSWSRSRPRSSQFVCSECHRTAYDPQPTRDKAWRKRCRYAYCPNCGAKMEVQDIKCVTQHQDDADTGGFFKRAGEVVKEVQDQA